MHAHRERVEVARERARRVGQRLAARELQLLRRKVHRRAAHLHHAGGERDARARRVLREVEAERRTGQQRLLRVGAQLHRVVEDRLCLGGREIGHAQEVAALQRDLQRCGHDQRSFAAATAAETSPSRSPAGGATKVPSRTAPATCSYASRNGTPSATSCSAASVARRSGSALAASSLARSNSSPATSTVSAPSAPATSLRAANTGGLSSCRSRS